MRSHGSVRVAGSIAMSLDLREACSYSTDEIMFVYLAGKLYECKEKPDDDEFIEVQQLPFAEAVQKVTAGEICDAKTIAGILLARERIMG